MIATIDTQDKNLQKALLLLFTFVAVAESKKLKL